MTNEKNAYLTVFESFRDPVIMLDENNRVVNLNFAAANLLDSQGSPGANYYSRLAKLGAEDLQNDAGKESYGRLSGGHGLLQSFPCLDRVVEKIADKATDSGVVECSMKQDDEEKHFEVSYSSMLDVSDKFTGTIITVRDVTEKVSATTELKLSEERYRLLTESMTD